MHGVDSSCICNLYVVIFVRLDKSPVFIYCLNVNIVIYPIVKLPKNTKDEF